jgi:hypothetical protein
MALHILTAHGFKLDFNPLKPDAVEVVNRVLFNAFFAVSTHTRPSLIAGLSSRTPPQISRENRKSSNN